ncbi:MAG: ribulose-phosphate 3-epimerase [Alphaproteobacteria bacterium]|nr:ribulose-phosphate 3-epimerase [Alphaproteobacteria bacterium]
MSKILSPSIMCADLGNLRQEIQALDAAGADVYHMDIMDGEFVPNFALSWADFAAVRKMTSTKMDAHLMVKDPSVHLPYAYKYGADIIYVHYEAGNSEQYLQDIRAHGREAGLAFNPETKLSEIEHLLPMTDRLLVMRVNPGFAGQKAIPEVEFKLYQLLQKERNFKISIDGSVSPEIIKKWGGKGVDEFVLGTSSLFGKDRSYKEILQELHGEAPSKQAANSNFLQIAKYQRMQRK